jgi:hypothetical protein
MDIFAPAEESFIIKAVCSWNGKQWAFVGYGGQMIFIDEINDKFVTCEKQLSQFFFDPAQDKNIKMVYSPDSRFVAVLFHNSRNNPRIALYNALTHEEIGTWYRFSEWLGFSVDSAKLIFQDKDTLCVIDLVPEKDYMVLDDLSSKKTSLLQLALLRRLYQAHKNNDTLELYEEGSSYKSFLQLSEDQRKLIEKCFPVIKVIDNKKDLSETCKDVAQIADAAIDDPKKKMLSWWDSIGK